MYECYTKLLKNNFEVTEVFVFNQIHFTYLVYAEESFNSQGLRLWQSKKDLIFFPLLMHNKESIVSGSNF